MFSRNFSKLIIFLMVLVLLLGISLPILKGYLSNQRLRGFASEIYRDLKKAQKDAVDNKIVPVFHDERIPEEIATIKVKILYQRQLGNEKPASVHNSGEDFLINCQGLSAFSQIKTGSHLDFFIEGSPKSAFSVLFCPDGNPYQKGVIFLSNGKKTISITISPTGNLKLQEDAPLT